MKRTNFRFSFPLGKMAILPLMLLGLFVFTTSGVNAQSFKSPEAAETSVKAALDELAQANVSPNTPQGKQNAINARVYTMFVQGMTTDISASYDSLLQKLDAIYSGNGKLKITKGSKDDLQLIDAAKDSLLDLITN